MGGFFQVVAARSAGVTCCRQNSGAKGGIEAAPPDNCEQLVTLTAIARLQAARYLIVRPLAQTMRQYGSSETAFHFGIGLQDMLLRWRATLGLGIGLGWMTLSSAAWSAPAVADTTTTALRLTVAEAVLGILAHTRWPQRAARPLLLCVNERSSSVLELRTLHDSIPAGKLAPVRLIDLADELPLDCDAVYLGAGPPAVEPLAQLIGRPVLSMGEGAEFCSRGGLFCLVPRSSGLRVEVNLDAVARSGLHIHPQVLKLGQPRPGGMP
jgi:hypothetical protein